MAKRKICVLVADYKSPWSEAIKNNTRDLIKELSKDYNFFCIGPSDKTDLINIDGIKSYLVKSPFYLTKFKRVFYPFGLIKLMLQAKKIIKKEKPDLILSNLESPSVGFVGKCLKGKAQFIQVVNASYYVPFNSPLKYWFMDELPHLLFNNKFFYKAGLQLADSNIVITDFLYKKISALGIKKIVKIPYGVDTKKFIAYAKNKKTRFTIGYLGHLIYAKGGGLLLEAVKELERKISIRLLLATTWGSEEKIFEKIKIKNLEYLGIIENQADFYNACDLFVLPLRTPTATLNMPQVILEAQSCGVPVLASDLENIREIIEDKKTGLLFKPNSSLDLMNKILSAYRNKNKSSFLVKAAQKNIKEKYDLKKVAPLWREELGK